MGIFWELTGGVDDVVLSEQPPPLSPLTFFFSDNCTSSTRTYMLVFDDVDLRDKRVKLFVEGGTAWSKFR